MLNIIFWMARVAKIEWQYLPTVKHMLWRGNSAVCRRILAISILFLKRLLNSILTPEKHLFGY